MGVLIELYPKKIQILGSVHTSGSCRFRDDNEIRLETKKVVGAIALRGHRNPIIVSVNRRVFGRIPCYVSKLMSLCMAHECIFQTTIVGEIEGDASLEPFHQT